MDFTIYRNGASTGITLHVAEERTGGSTNPIDYPVFGGDLIALRWQSQGEEQNNRVSASIIYVPN